MAGVISNWASGQVLQAARALLCLAAIQGLLVLSNCQAEPAAMAARVVAGH